MTPEPQEVNSAEKFLIEQNILLDGGVWVCHDLNNNVRTFDIKQLLEDYAKSSQSKLPVDNGDVVEMAEKKYPRTFYDGTLTLDDKNYEIKRNAFIEGCRASQSKLTGTVFVKVSVKDRLPDKEQRYFTEYGYIQFLSEKKKFIGEYASYVMPQWWLEETAAPKLYSEEQMIGFAEWIGIHGWNVSDYNKENSIVWNNESYNLAKTTKLITQKTTEELLDDYINSPQPKQ